jgi:hypothetical protein
MAFIADMPVDPQYSRRDAGNVGCLVYVGECGRVSSRLLSFHNDVDYPVTDYALIALFGLVCFSVAVFAPRGRAAAMPELTAIAMSAARAQTELTRISMPLLADAVFIQIWDVPLSSRRSVIAHAFAALTAYEQLALAIVAAGGVVIGVAAFAVFGAFRIRYSRRASIASFLLVLSGLAFVWLAVGVRVDPETASRLRLDVVYGAMSWIATAAMVITTVHVFWNGFAERVLTIRYVGGAVAISAAFGAAWLTALHVAGVQLAGSRPNTRTEPVVARSRPSRCLRSVVLPAPLAPTRPSALWR